MGVGYITNDPKKSVVFPVVIPYELSGSGYEALMRLCAFYKEEPSKIIDRLIKEKASCILK